MAATMNATVPSSPVLAGPPGRLDASVDDETYEAGSGNIVVITIKNPFNVPVRIIELKEPRSSNLKSSTQNTVAPSIIRGSSSQFASGLKHAFGSVVGYSIGFGGLKAEFTSQKKSSSLEINADGDSTVDIGSIGATLDQYSNVRVNASGAAKIIATAPSSYPDKLDNIIIQPHCEINAYLDIYTRGWLFFKPTKLKLKSELHYCLGSDNTEFTQVLSLNFDARPPLRSIIIGSIIGAALGWIARFVKLFSEIPTDILQISAKEFIYLGVMLGGSVVMSIISAMALSRKTGAQGFITVEDFFGGFVIGALVGYQGTAYFENLLTQAVPANNPASPAG
ncbi:hypothetical protein SAMN02799625_04433 [Methylobacterium sp. UNC300MFChir4.1]|nr:hypothetical protein SAMN02799625_04433 [Methylobacterium sp. UNC300MFChir4.1]